MKILIVDDEAAVQGAYRHALEKSQTSRAGEALSSLAAGLFDDQAPDAAAEPADALNLTIASQGLDAVALVAEALADNRPFQVAFIDIRMPPGIDGKETARRIRLLDPDINLVIVTGYSDHSVTDIASVAGPADKIFYIAKPFAADEVRQMAVALGKRWANDARQVERLRVQLVELAASEARAVHAANHDALTGAPNRLSFRRSLAQRLQGTSREFGLALLDLDHFKHVNDTFGHAAGDDLLIEIFDVIKHVAPSVTQVARLGGDEFGLLIDGDRATVMSICEKITRACAQSFTIFGNTVSISASIGIVYPADFPTHDALELKRYADLALFSAKRGQRGRIAEFDARLDASARFRRMIEEGLHHAIAHNEFSLHYQPIVERSSLSIVGFEALLRWTSAEHGPISPTVFIPIAEEGALIHQIGDWVVRQALADSHLWPDQYVSINFSPRQFKRNDLVQSLCEAAEAADVAFERIQIEVTETAVFENVERATTALRQFKDFGFRIALDDFGTGYSSLFHVKNFALDCIKIDKSFIDMVGNEANSMAIVSSIIHLARNLGISVIAEGVETELQCQALRVAGCSNMQGYFFGRPATADHSLALVEHQASAPPLASVPLRRVV